VRVEVKLNDTDLKAAVERLKAKMPQAIARALKRTGVSARLAMSTAIVEDTGLPAKRVKDEIKIAQSAGAVQLQIAGRRLPLVDFKAKGPEPSRGRGRGVSWKLRGGRGRDPHAFIATMPSGHRGVFRRRGTSRLTISELFGPSLVRVFEKYLPIGAERGQEALVTNLKHEMDFVLSRR